MGHVVQAEQGNEGLYRMGLGGYVLAMPGMAPDVQA